MALTNVARTTSAVLQFSPNISNTKKALISYLIACVPQSTISI